MGRHAASSCRICRSKRLKLFLKGEKCTTKCVLDRGKRKNPPGQHMRTTTKVSEYGRHLIEKQKIKYLFSIRERQLRNYFRIASKMKGLTGENLLLLLERRLDSVLCRLGIASSMRFAGQLITHRKVLVNGHIKAVPAYRVKSGDKIQLKDKMRENVMVKRSLESHQIIPAWLELDKVNCAGNIVSLPTRQDISYPIDETLIVEFYSR